MKKSHLLCALFSGMFTFSAGSQATLSIASSYDIDILGFLDAEHTRDDGYRYSEVVGFNEAGQAAGYSRRYDNITGASLGFSAWFYNGVTLMNIGLTEAEYTRNDGYRSSFASFLNEAGQVAGSSRRYDNITGADLGRSAWLYNGTGTVNIGLTDAQHTRDDGYRSSGTVFLNEAGQVAGVAGYYDYDYAYPPPDYEEYPGLSAWLYNGTSTLRIGLTDAEHTRNDGYQRSELAGFNEAGQVAGSSFRFDTTTGADLGNSVWIYNGSTTVNIGLTDAEHTRTDGYRFSNYECNDEAVCFNEAGQMLGSAWRYDSTTGADLGLSAWLYNGTGTVNIGLTDAEHTRNDGFRWNYGDRLNQAGDVAGESMRFDPATGVQIGKSAWLYNGSSALRIGLTDAEHTRNDGYQRSLTYHLNEAGQVAGTSSRYDSATGADLGSSAWLYNGTTTVNIGLTDAEHTRNDGYRYSSPYFLNEVGQVAGRASRYDDATGASLGSSAWLYNGTGTVNIGLTDTEHTRDDGYRHSEVTHLNEAGQAAGYSRRYNNTTGASLGLSAWLYDMTIDQTFAIDLSVSSNGFARSGIAYLDDNGLALGSYYLFDADDSILGFRAFAFTVEDGAFDLGALVDGGLSDAGWEYLADAFMANDLGQILGYGLLSDGISEMSYVMTPVSAVPIPAAVWLFCTGLLGLVGMARRKKAA